MQNKPTLLIMAAGMASRYGGIKQLEQVGPSGEIIMDYSIYAALDAGYEDLIIVIKREMEEDFENVIGRRLRPHINLKYAFQDIEDLPSGYKRPKDRVKPWGTGHAVLAAREIIDSPFTVINADDYYGSDAFRLMFNFQNQSISRSKRQEHALCTWILRNTLSLHGTVSRGVCELGSDGQLLSIRELKKIAVSGNDAAYTLDDGESWQALSGDSPVSMNFFGFSPDFMSLLADKFETFLDREAVGDPLSAEFLLPEILGSQLNNSKCHIHTMQSEDRWFGVTYKEDRPIVERSLNELVERGVYPTPLWK